MVGRQGHGGDLPGRQLERARREGGAGRLLVGPGADRRGQQHRRHPIDVGRVVGHRRHDRHRRPPAAVPIDGGLQHPGLGGQHHLGAQDPVGPRREAATRVAHGVDVDHRSLPPSAGEPDRALPPGGAPEVDGAAGHEGPPVGAVDRCLPHERGHAVVLVAEPGGHGGQGAQAHVGRRGGRHPRGGDPEQVHHQRRPRPPGGGCGGDRRGDGADRRRRHVGPQPPRQASRDADLVTDLTAPGAGDHRDGRDPSRGEGVVAGDPQALDAGSGRHRRPGGGGVAPRQHRVGLHQDHPTTGGHQVERRDQEQRRRVGVAAHDGTQPGPQRRRPGRRPGRRRRQLVLERRVADHRGEPAAGQPRPHVVRCAEQRIGHDHVLGQGGRRRVPIGSRRGCGAVLQPGQHGPPGHGHRVGVDVGPPQQLTDDRRRPVPLRRQRIGGRQQEGAGADRGVAHRREATAEGAGTAIGQGHGHQRVGNRPRRVHRAARPVGGLERRLVGRDQGVGPGAPRRPTRRRGRCGGRGPPRRLLVLVGPARAGGRHLSRSRC